MNVSNCGKQRKRKSRPLARIMAALIAFLQIGFSPVMVSAGSVSAANGTKEPSPRKETNAKNQKGTRIWGTRIKKFYNFFGNGMTLRRHAVVFLAYSAENSISPMKL